MTPSLPPNNGLKIKIGPVCVYINRRVALLILSMAIAGGGGGWAVMGLATSGDLDGVIETNSRYATASDTRHKTAETRLDNHDEQLRTITVKIGSIQEVQHWQTADQSAERVCQQVAKSKRRACEKRLFKWSFDRLRDGETRPCTNLDCSD